MYIVDYSNRENELTFPERDVNAERNFNDYIHNYIMVNRQPVICGYDTYINVTGYYAVL